MLIGEIVKNLHLMAFGLFIFGFGEGPLAVVQETIIVHFFKNYGLGVSMAVALVAGKATGFISVHTSYPLSERYGSHAPFYVATVLAGLSVIGNLVYIWSSNWLVESRGTGIEENGNGSFSLSESQALGKIVAKKRMHLDEVTMLDDVFWTSVLRYPYRSVIDFVSADILVLMFSVVQYGHLLFSLLRR